MIAVESKKGVMDNFKVTSLVVRFLKHRNHRPISECVSYIGNKEQNPCLFLDSDVNACLLKS